MTFLRKLIDIITLICRHIVMPSRFILSTIPIIVIIASCAPPISTATAQSQQATSLQARSSFLLTPAQRSKIARKIWQNESAGTIKGLTAWNEGENFPSLGIGHFICYPRGVQEKFTESFPQFISFARQRGATPPTIALSSNAPWRSRTEFHQQFNSPSMIELRRWLANNLTLQADFIIAKSQASFGKIIAQAPPANRARIQSNYQKVSTTSHGMYALIDYVNFKGEGTNPKERYQGQGWGLMQVLQNMRDVPSGQAAAREFSAAAKRTLGKRIKNSPPSRGENRWRAGWFNRCDTYAQPL